MDHPNPLNVKSSFTWFLREFLFFTWNLRAFSLSFPILRVPHYFPLPLTTSSSSFFSSLSSTNSIFCCGSSHTTNRPYHDPLFGTIGEYLFFSSRSQVKSCYETNFIQGIKVGNLCPLIFIHLNLQDAIYCLSGYQDYHRVIELINQELLFPNHKNQNQKNRNFKHWDWGGQPQQQQKQQLMEQWSQRVFYLNKLKALLELKSMSSKSYKFTLFHSLNLLSFSPQDHQLQPQRLPSPCSAIEDYISWKRYVIETFDPIYALVAMLLCERLWAYLRDRLLFDQMENPVQSKNRYLSWRLIGRLCVSRRDLDL